LLLPSLVLSERSSSDMAAEDITLSCTVGDIALPRDRLLEWRLLPRLRSAEWRLKLMRRQVTSYKNKK
jgi:hypothetical protein